MQMKPIQCPNAGSYGSHDGAKMALQVFMKEAKCPKGQIPVRRPRNPSTDVANGDRFTAATRKYVHQVSNLSQPIQVAISSNLFIYAKK